MCCWSILWTVVQLSNSDNQTKIYIHFYWCADRLYVEDKKNENKCSSVFSFVLAKERTLCIAHVRVFAESWINVLKYWICPWPIKYAATFALWSSCSGLPKAWLLLSYQIRWIGNKTLAVIKLLNSC